MEFRKYNSIENSYRQKFIDMITIDPELMGESWYVHEKIHGANFAIFVKRDMDNTINVEFGKRSGFIKEDEKFYSFDLIREELYEHAVRVALFINKPDVDIIIRGELFGGGYDHPDVDNNGHSQVQRGVSYCNTTKFMAFDLEVGGKIVDWIAAHHIFYHTDVPTAPELFYGSFEDCMKIGNEFNSHVPALYDLPALDVNICEGVVIKPNTARYFNNGSRVILKNKNEKFTEKSKTKKKSKVILFTDEMNEAVVNIDQFINENRLSNVLSHFGEIKQRDFGKVCGLFAQDVILDYLKEYEPLPEKKDWKLVTKQTSNSCAMLLRTKWLDILDGEY